MTAKKAAQCKKKGKQSKKKVPETKKLISMAEYARQRDVSYSIIKRHVSKGRLTKVNGQIDPEKADLELAQKLDVRQSKNSKLVKKTSDLSAFNKAKTRRELAKAELAELELAEKADLLITVEQVEREAETLYRNYRDQMLNVVIRATKKLLGVTDEFEFRNILKKEIEDAIRKVCK